MSDHTVIGNIDNNLIIQTKYNAPNQQIISVEYKNANIKNGKKLRKQTKNPIIHASIVGKYILVNYNENVNQLYNIIIMAKK